MTIHVKANGKVYDKTRPSNKPFVTLELSKEAAQALMYVVGSVGGSAEGMQKHTNAVFRALNAEGLSTENYSEVIDGVLNFKY